MDTKWKKWKIRCSMVLFVVGFSLFVAGASELFFRVSNQGGVESLFTEQSSDYQDTKKFREFISSRIESFLAMICGDYVYGVADYGYYGVSYGDAVEGQWEHSYNTAEAIDQGDLEGSLELQEEVVDSELASETSESEKKASGQNFFNHIKEDKNILFRVKNKNGLSYSNMDGITWDGNEKKLPANYNFYLHFDGEKVVVIKDGKSVDIYGDGLYREGEDYAFPGFQNYPVLEKWKQVDIVMLAAKTPVYYRNSSMEESVINNDLYCLYEDLVRSRAKIFSAVLSMAAGMLLLFVSMFLRGKVSAGKRIAALTGKIWMEWKILLFLVVPILYLTFVIGNRYGVYYEDAAYVDWTFEEYIAENYWYLRDFFWSSPMLVLLLFWCAYLLLNDLFRNRGGYRHSLVGKLLKEQDTRFLQLPLVKKIVKRFGGILAGLFLQTFCVATLLVCLIVHTEYAYPRRMGAGGWILAVVAVLLQVYLIAFAYRYAKNNKMLACDLDGLSAQIEAIRNGDYKASAEFSAEDSDIRQLARNLEEIRRGMEHAVEERIKSERMKVELVANVSHDIKTPLTSIISYVKLLKQEKNLPAHVADYITILDEKSERLKTMVQDVFSVSKAVSGQLDVNFEELDFGKLLYQTLADMEEQIAAAPVTVKTEIPETPLVVKADGSRLYRVFQNLITNAVRYSLEGTRIYITLKRDGDVAAACIKNISSQELDPGMDFSERFVRGDESRTDGGSGLGLSIAKSFTEACGGTFQVEVNADLFIVTVAFPIV